jgi:excisionase family DNA binding protein
MPKEPEMANLFHTPPQSPNRAARRRYVKIAEAAEYLHCTDRTIRQMIVDGRLTAYRNGGRLVRLDLNEIDAAMQPFGGAA